MKKQKKKASARRCTVPGCERITLRGVCERCRNKALH